MKKLFLLMFSVLAAGCSSQPDPLKLGDSKNYWLDTTHESKTVGQNDRIRHLVFHYTALDDEESLKTLTTEQVSAHYLIPSSPPMVRNMPAVFQLVPEDKRAWHAGVSSWKNRTNINDTSIGIEIVGLGYRDDEAGGRVWFPYPREQMSVVAALAKDIVQRYKIEPADVLAHSDIAPTRKSDPGPLFIWKALAQAGVGAWPDADTVQRYLAGRDEDAPGDIALLQKNLARYGYEIPQTGVLDKQTREVFRAFQMHFRPASFSGTPDAGTEAIASALVDKYR